MLSIKAKRMDIYKSNDQKFENSRRDENLCQEFLEVRKI